MSISRLPNGRFRVQIRRKGFPRYDKVFKDRRSAEAAETAALSSLDTTSPANAAEMTLEQAWARYSDSMQYREKAEQTRQTERTRIKPVLATLGQYSLANLEAAPHLIHNYMDTRSRTVSARTKKRISSTSIRLEVAALSAVIKWAKQRRILRDNFMRRIDRPGQAKRKRRVPTLEQAKLRQATPHWNPPQLAEAARFVLVLRLLGSRPGELKRVLRSDIHFDDKTITFRNTKHKGEDRSVHLTPNAIEYVNAQFEHALSVAPDSPFLFSTLSFKKDSNGRRTWQPYNYSHGINLLRDAGLVDKDFHAHAMRREFISRAIEGNVGYATIRKQTGHHSTQAIEIYDEGLATAPEIREALDKHESAQSVEQTLALMQAHGVSKSVLDEAKREMEGRSKGAVRKPYANGEISDF